MRALVHLLLVRPLLRGLFGVQVEGLRHLRGLRQCMLVANHNSHLDAFILSAILPLRQAMRIRPVAAADYFSRRRALRWVADTLLRPVWVVRGGDPRRAVEQMAVVLRAGGSLILFPEGTRGEPGRIGPFRTGVGRLAEMFPAVPVVPVLLSGTARALPRGQAVPLPLRQRVLVGPPELCRGSCAEIAAHLEARVREIAGSEAAAGHRRAPRRPRPLTVAVLGIDGSGKSTLARAAGIALSRRRRTCVIGDRTTFYLRGEVEPMQPLLAERVRLALGRRARRAASARGYQLPKAAEILLRDYLMSQVHRWHAAEVIVLDGSPLVNLLAWSGLYRKQPLDAEACAAFVAALTGAGAPSDPSLRRRFPELRALGAMDLQVLRLPDLIFLLDLDPFEALRRIASRGGARQLHETADGLASLRQGYRTVCQVVRDRFGVQVEMLDPLAPLEQLVGIVRDRVLGPAREEVPEDAVSG